MLMTVPMRGFFIWFMVMLLTQENRFFRRSAAAIAIFGLFLPISLPQYALIPDKNRLETYSIDWASGRDDLSFLAKKNHNEAVENGSVWKNDAEFLNGLDVISGNALIKTNPPVVKKPTRKIKIVVTAYSSTPDQTDSTPFITASGSRARDGVVANNSLPFGTRVKFPQIFGDKIFVIEDRMAPKNSHKADIWMPTRQMALNFGVKYTEMEIL